MKPLSKPLLILAAMAVGTCLVAQSRPDGESSPERRIHIKVADNKSVYTTVSERNNYENLLQLQQPDGPYQLTASMLNEGDNVITFHRIDDQGIDNAVARINLNAQFDVPGLKVVDSFDFGDKVVQTETTVTQAMLSGGWGTNGSNLIWKTDGSAYVTGQGGLTFTVPAGYSNATMQLIAYVGSSVGGGYFITKLNDGDWTVEAEATAGAGVVVKTFSGLNSGDVISIYGATYYNSSYYYSNSPDIELIAFREIPPTFTPTVEVIPTVSYNDGGTWSVPQDLTPSATYSVNDTIDLYGLGTVSDAFYASTVLNEHSGYYDYSVDYDANIALPYGGATGLDFYASADFAAATTSTPASAAMTGPNNWSFTSTNVYTPSAGQCCYIVSYGSILYTMPRSFMGNSVNVTVTSSTGDGAGDLYVNGILHTFAAGETYTWTIPVAAGGVIEFKANVAGSLTNNFSIDFTKIIISSGNGAAMHAPAHTGSIVDTPSARFIDRPLVEPMDKNSKTIIVK